MQKIPGVAAALAVALVGYTALAARQVPAQTGAQRGAQAAPVIVPPFPGETHLANIRQLTFGGENAEAYFSRDGQRLIFQSTREGHACDQQYTMRLDGSDLRRVSTGEGRTTCGFFTPDGRHIIYASTHLAGKECPPKPDFSRGYVWPIYASYDIFRARVDGSQLTRLTTTPGYDAEATIAPDGTIVFTSVRDGDMEVYTMNADGSNVKRLTNTPGPDGGPFFSYDGSLIAWRGKHLTDPKELSEYQALLKEGLWRPTDLEVFVMNRDGSNVRQVTDSTGSNFAPFIHPDNKRLIFASNRLDPQGRNFDLYVTRIDQPNLAQPERITFNESFDGFAMWSPDGEKLVFASNRHNVNPTDTNIFIADWVENRDQP